MFKIKSKYKHGLFEVWLDLLSDNSETFNVYLKGNYNTLTHATYACCSKDEALKLCDELNKLTQCFEQL